MLLVVLLVVFLTFWLSIRLYRGDSLSILQNSSGHKTDQIKKINIKLFQKQDLKITIEANLKQTDFLDVKLNIKTKKHWPFKKPNDQQLYIKNYVL